MKKKLTIILSLVLAMALCLGILAACAKGLSTDQLDKLYKEFQRDHRDDATETATSYYVGGKVSYLEDGGNEISANIKWTIEGTTLVTVGETPNAMGQYQIVVPETVDETINYKLVGTMVDESGNPYKNSEGNPYKLELSKTVSAGKGLGTEDAPYSVTAALAEYATVASGDWSEGKIYVKGIVVTKPSYSAGHQSYSFYIADSKDSSSRLQVYSGTLASGLEKVCENDTVVVYGFYTKYNTTPEITGSTKDGEKHDYPVITSRTIGTSAITATPGENYEIKDLSKTSGANGETFTFKVSSKNGATISGVKVNGDDVTAVNDVYTGTIDGDTTITVIALIATEGEQTITVNLATDFANYAKEWSTSYGEKTLDSATLNVNQINLSLVLSNANKSGQTITDIPVMASKESNYQYATLSVSGCQINEITFNLRQWGSAKTFNTLCIEYTTDGENWTAVDGVGFIDANPKQAVANYTTLKAENLTPGVKAVRLVIMSDYSSNTQVGLEGFVVKTGPAQQPVVDNTVVRIGSTGYDTLAEAVAAAQANDEIVLKKDITLEETISISKAVKINLNNHNITIAKSTAGTIINMFVVGDNGNLTITGEGNVRNEHTDGYIVSAQGTGIVTIESGNYYTDDSSIVQVKDSAKAYIKDGKFEVNGEYEWGTKYVLNKIDADKATTVIEVTGGSFVNYDPANSTSEDPAVSFVAEGYESTSKTDGTNTIYTVAAALPFVKADVNNLQENKAYKLAMTNTQLGKTVYMKNEFSGFYIASTDNITEADDIYVEVVEGGVKLYFKDGDNRIYLGACSRDTDLTKKSYNIALGGKVGKANSGSESAEPATGIIVREVWTVAAECIKININPDGTANEAFVGNYGDRTTLAMSAISYLTSGNYAAYLVEVK